MSKRTIWLAGLVDVIFTIILGFLALRVILKLFGASAAAPFAQWIYATSDPLLTPFVGMFPAPTIDGLFVIEFTALFALVIYAMLQALILRLIDWSHAGQSDR